MVMVNLTNLLKMNIGRIGWLCNSMQLFLQDDNYWLFVNILLNYFPKETIIVWKSIWFRRFY